MTITKPFALKSFALIGLCLIVLTNCNTKSNEAASAEAARQLTDFANQLSPSRGRGQGMAADSMSAESFGRALQKTKDQLTTLRAIDTSLLRGDDLIDWKFAQSILVGRELDRRIISPGSVTHAST